ncbi:3540_t:CDS:2 [Entrophospora sp. SA101]|nr:18939_t:CDS:2 [Entrophospora sp. SA101]CAJ0919987.1 3540_t:CDS:2 [Entrophospora sp. SA101]
MSDRYSFSLTTFSPSGKLVQIEYALNAVAQGVTSIGIKATNGVVVATEKKTASPLIDDSSLEKVANVCPNIGIVYSGMGPDFRVLLTKARKAAQKYKRIYNEYPPTGILVKEVASVMQEFTQSGYNDDIGLEDAVHTSILTLKEGFEGQMTENSIEIGIIGGDTTGFMEGKEQPLFRKLSPSEVKDYLANIA